MRALIRAEVLKLRTLPLNAALAVGATALSAVLGVAIGQSPEHAAGVSLSDAARAPLQPLWFVVLLATALAAAGEFQHGTITATLLGAPRRRSVLMAKVAAAALYGQVVVLAGTIACVTGAIASTRIRGTTFAVDGPAVKVVVAAALVTALLAAAATALGVLTKSSTVAVVAFLLWKFVGEGVLPVVLRRPGLSSWLPDGLAGRMTAPTGSASGAVLAAAALGGYVLVVVALAGRRFLRSDPKLA